MPRAATIDSPRLRRLERAIARGDTGAESRFWDELAKAGTPLVERIPGDRAHVRVTYLWRGAPGTRSVGLAAPHSEFGTLERLNRLPKTRVWYRTTRTPKDLFGTYFFVPNAKALQPEEMSEWLRIYRRARVDPLNPLRFGKPKDPELPHHPLNGVALSAFSLPAAPHHPEAVREPGVPEGTLRLDRVRSRHLRGPRRIWSYVPAAGLPVSGDAALVIFTDGFWYTHEINAPTTLDNLIHRGEIPPTAAIFVDALDLPTRTRELSCPPSFGRFLVGELLPWCRRRFGRSFRAERTVLAGASLGGLTALYWALQHPKRFGGVISQSGSFWWAPKSSDEPLAIAHEVMERPGLPTRVYLDAGRYEAASVVENSVGHLAANRHVRDLLRTKGYPVFFQMYSGGHDDYCWKETLVDGLRWVVAGRDPSRRP